MKVWVFLLVLGVLVTAFAEETKQEVASESSEDDNEEEAMSDNDMDQNEEDAVDADEEKSESISSSSSDFSDYEGDKYADSTDESDSDSDSSSSSEEDEDEEQDFARDPTKLTREVFQNMWENYPLPHSSNEEVRKYIGGSVDSSWLTNTCTIRLSRCFNYAGSSYFKVPWGFKISSKKKMAVKRGADKKRYAYRVAEFTPYLKWLLGEATLKWTNPNEAKRGTIPIPPEFQGVEGIILFQVPPGFWSDASGHFDLWRDSDCRDHCRFAESQYVYLWEPYGYRAKPTPVSTPKPTPKKDTRSYKYCKRPNGSTSTCLRYYSKSGHVYVNNNCKNTTYSVKAWCSRKYRGRYYNLRPGKTIFWRNCKWPYVRAF